MSLELEPLQTKWLGDNKSYLKMLRSSMEETRKAVKFINAEIAKIKPMPGMGGGKRGGLGAGGAFVPGARGKGGKGGGAGAMGFAASGFSAVGSLAGLDPTTLSTVFQWLSKIPSVLSRMGDSIRKLPKDMWERKVYDRIRNFPRDLKNVANGGSWVKSSFTKLAAQAIRSAIAIGGVTTAAVGATAAVVFFYERWSTESKNAAKWAETTRKGTEKWLEMFKSINEERSNAINDKRRFGGSELDQLEELKAFGADLTGTMENAEKQAMDMGAQLEKSKKSWLGWAGIDFGSQETSKAHMEDAQKRAKAAREEARAVQRQIELLEKERAFRRETTIKDFSSGFDTRKNRIRLDGMTYGQGKDQIEENIRIFELKQKLQSQEQKLSDSEERRLRNLIKQSQEMEKQIKQREFMDETIKGLGTEAAKLQLQLTAEEQKWSEEKLAVEQQMLGIKNQLATQGLSINDAEERRLRKLLEQNEALRQQQKEIEKQKQKQEEMEEAMRARDEEFKGVQQEMAAKAADLLNSQLSDLAKLKEEIAGVNNLVANGALSRDQADGIIGKMKKEFTDQFRGGLTDNSAGAATQAGSLEAYQATKFGIHERSIDINIEKMLKENKEQTTTQQKLLEVMQGNPAQQAFEYVGIG